MTVALPADVPSNQNGNEAAQAQLSLSIPVPDSSGSHPSHVNEPCQNGEPERATNPVQSQTTLQQCGIGTRPVSGHYSTQSASYSTDEHSVVRLDGNDSADLGRLEAGHANTSSYNNERLSADSGFIEPIHANIKGPNIAYKTISFDTNFTVPATPYRPGLFDTNCAGPSIYY